MTDAITPDDLKNKLGELKDSVEITAEGAKGAATKGVIAGAIILILMVFFLGRKRGQAGRTVVEVRRI